MSKKILVILAAMLAAQFFIFPVIAFAHRPHDVVTAMRLAPFCLDGLAGCVTALFIIVRNNLFRSTNKGKRWERLVKGLDNFHPPTDLAAGINGDKATLLMSSEGDGIYRSIDGGRSWEKANDGLPTPNVLKLAFAPGSDLIAFSVLREGDLCKTVNGGETWEKIQDISGVTAVAVHPKEGNKLLIGNSSGDILCSDDCGGNWLKVYSLGSVSIECLAFDLTDSSGKSVFAGTKNKGLIRIDPDASKSYLTSGVPDNWIRKVVIVSEGGANKIFALGANEGLFVSEDRGNVWNKLEKGITRNKQATEKKYNSSHFIDMEISNDFLKDQFILVGGFDGMFLSANAGSTWKEPPSLPERSLVGLSVLAGKEDNRIAVINYMASACLSEDGGKTWKNIAWDFKYPHYKNDRVGSEPFEIREPRFYDICFSPEFGDDNIIFASLIYGVFRSENGGTKWKPVLQPTGKDNLVRCTVLAVSPAFKTDSTVFALTQQGHVYRSNDKGKTFEQISLIGHQKGNGSPTLAISPEYDKDNTLFATGPDGVYRSKDRGHSWECVSDERFKDLADYRLAMAPDYPKNGALLLGTERGLFVTHDNGGNWTQCAFNGEMCVWVKGMAFSPLYESDGTFLVSIKGKGLFKTEDRGASFYKIGDDNLLFGRLSGLESASMPVAFSPKYGKDNTIYAFGSPESEFFRSTDRGENWEIVKVPYNSFDLRGACVLAVRCLKFFLAGVKNILK